MLWFRLCLLGLLSSVRWAIALSCTAVLLLSSSESFAHEGHDHGQSAREALTASTYPRVTAHSELYEIVGVLKGDRLSIYLDHFATNEPVTNAKLTVMIGDAEPIEAKQSNVGLHILPLPSLSGLVEVIFAVSAPSGDDLLVGSITVPTGSASRPTPGPISGPVLSKWTEAIPSPIRNPIVLVLIAFGLGTLFGRLRRDGRLLPAVATGAAAVGVLMVLVAVALSHEDHDHADTATTPARGGEMSDAPRRLPDGMAFVAKPTQRLLEVRTVAVRPATARPSVSLIGRVIGDPNRSSVVQSIHGGRVIPLDGGLPHIGQTVRKGDVLAQVDPYLPLADRTTILEKTGEIDQLIAVAEARVRRLRPLAERGAVPTSQVTDIETELEGLRARREVIRNTRTEPELLRAPTDGVIAMAKVVPGQVVQPQDILFQIVDPTSFWVEALAYGDVDPASLADATAATTNGQAMPLVYQGVSRSLQQHAALVHFSIAEPLPNLNTGQPVTVAAKSGAPMTGFIVPRDAAVRSGNGETIVWVHVDPERFEPRPVRTQPFDTARLIVAAGVTEGDRIVVRGADLINQVR